jgi:serine/threonine protein kinase
MSHPPEANDHDNIVAAVLESWQRGAEPDAQKALASHPELNDEETCVLDLATTEYRIRLARGETMVPSVFSRQFSTHRRTIRRFLELQSVVTGKIKEQLSKIFWPSVGDKVLNFELVRELGRGAFSRVFVARELDLGGRIVALKLTHYKTDEPATLGRLQHDRIVRVYSVEFSKQWKLNAICMEYDGAKTLQHITHFIRDSRHVPDAGDVVQQIAESVPISKIQQANDTDYVSVVFRLVEEIAEALAYTHARGVIHHDIKPSNVLLSGEGTAKLLDFNLSQDIRSDVVRQGGTLPYMSPEHLAEVFFDAHTPASDHRSDLFSVGIIAYELLSGRLPWETQWSDDIDFDALKHREEMNNCPAQISSLNPDVPQELNDIVHRCLELRVEDRFQTARALLDAIRHERQSRETAPRKSVSTNVRLLIFASAVLFAGFAFFLSPFVKTQAPPTLDEVLADAGVFVKAGEPLLALRYLREHEEPHKTKSRYHAAQGALLVANGDRPEVCGAAFERAIALAHDEKLPDLYNDLAVCLAKQGKYESAFKYWNLALAKDPTHPLAQLNYAFYSTVARVQRKQPPGMMTVQEGTRAAEFTAGIHDGNMFVSFYAATVYTVARSHGMESAQEDATYFALRALEQGMPANQITGILHFSKQQWPESIGTALARATAQGKKKVSDGGVDFDTHKLTAKIASAQSLME